ncbi:MAG: TonB-dependent receptor [Rikenellaceae bacterium]
MRNKYILILLFVILCSPFSGMAQHVIKGVISSSTDNATLIGATVTEVDASNRFIAGASTDRDGNYQLKVSSPNALIRVSYIGFISQDIVLNGRTTLDVILDEDMQQMESVVVVAQTQSNNGLMPILERDMSTSVARLDMSSLEDVAANNIGELMQGRMSGVDITSVSGDPGAGMSIRIRGTSTLSSDAEPLIVVDGIPYETDIDDGTNFATATEEEYGAMLDISPSDIQSIEVLKDAAAAAVWGSQGANGVLIITTKRGTKGRTTFNYDSKFTVSWEPDATPMLSGAEYVTLQTEARFNAYGLNTLPSELSYDTSWYNYYNYAQDTDWFEAITQTAFTQEHNMSLTGGGEKARYRASVSYLDQQGTTINTSLQRLTARFNVDYDLSDRMRFSADISYANSDNQRSYSAYDGAENIRSVALRKASNMAIYEMDSAGNSTGKYFSPYSSYQGLGTTYYNPVALANDGLNNQISNRIITKFSLRYYLKPEVLQWQADAAFDFMDYNTRCFFPQTASGADWSDSSMNTVNVSDNESVMMQTYNKLIYTPKLGEDHRFTALALISTYDKTNALMSSKVSNTATSSLAVLSGSDYVNSLQSQKSQIRQLAYLLNVNYVYLDRYIISAGVRYDGDSRFGEDSRWGAFPSLSLAWRASSEQFAESWDWLTEFKLKASYGENGTPPSTSYGHYSKYSASGSYIDQSSIVPSNIQLSNLKWETVIQSNAGFDFGLFENRVSGAFDIYNKRTKDVIFTSVSIPSTSGYSTLEAQNWGTIDNKGWELYVTTNIYKNRDWSVDFSMNFAQNKNIIVEIPDDYDNESYTFGNGQYAYRIEESKPMGSIYGYRYLGVYSTTADTEVRDADGNAVYNPTTGETLKMMPGAGSSSFKAGDAMYEDVNFDGIIDEHDIVYLGDSNPLLTGGFGPNIRYKNFSLSAFFHYKYDFDVINYARMLTENMYTTDNQSIATLNRWKKEGDVTDTPRAVLGTSYNWLGSDRFVEDASYLRLKTLSVAYNFDKEKLRSAHIRACKVYLTAYNLFTWTNYTGQDPEISMSSGNPFAVATDSSKTPPSKTVTLGLNISF